MLRRLELWLASPSRRRFYGWLDWWAFCGMLVRYERQYGTRIGLEEVDEATMAEEGGWLMNNLNDQHERTPVYWPSGWVYIVGAAVWILLVLMAMAVAREIW